MSTIHPSLSASVASLLVLYSSGPLESSTSLGSMLRPAQETVFNPFLRELATLLRVCIVRLTKSERLKASGWD